jgi:hypothetical protein
MSPMKTPHSKKFSDIVLPFHSTGLQSPEKDSSALVSLGIIGMYEYFKLTSIMASSDTSVIEGLMKKI